MRMNQDSGGKAVTKELELDRQLSKLKELKGKTQNEDKWDDLTIFSPLSANQIFCAEN